MKGNIDACNNLDELKENDAEQKKAISKGYGFNLGKAELI